MKGQKFFTAFLILIIIGGLAYIIWSFFIAPGNHIGMSWPKLNLSGNNQQTEHGQNHTNPSNQNLSQPTMQINS